MALLAGDEGVSEQAGELRVAKGDLSGLGLKEGIQSKSKPRVTATDVDTAEHGPSKT